METIGYSADRVLDIWVLAINLQSPSIVKAQVLLHNGRLGSEGKIRDGINPNQLRGWTSSNQFFPITSSSRSNGPVVQMLSFPACAKEYGGLLLGDT
jgi:hypothetical protein